MNHVLVVDDEPDICRSLEAILADEGYAVTTAATAQEASELVRDADFDAVLLDIWLPDRDGLELLSEIRARDARRAPEIIIISGHGTIETAVRATKLGAFDFLEKPLSLERTLIIVKNAIQARRLRIENHEFLQQLTARARITGNSVSVKALRQQIRLMAPTNGRVLIYGESGTGKELIARAMHAEGTRAERVFVELNCAAIPEDFIESELFGFRHGALPGGPQEKRGTFERADGGTLLLDEVGDMSLKTQAKVLRVLEEQRVEPVGSNEPVHVDARVIAATNKRLEEEIARGTFREDLFYRLNVIPVSVPPLRERTEDVPVLAAHFLSEYSAAYGRKPKQMTPAANAVLLRYPWPGNVRELKNVIERLVIMCPEDSIEPLHLPPELFRGAARSPQSNVATLQEARSAYEREFILRKLEENQWNMTRTAEALGLERSHLYRKMKVLGISAESA